MSGPPLTEPRLADEAFLADLAAATVAPDVLHLWWLGQSGFLVSAGGARLVLDPYLSDTLTAKYARTDRPHVRMARRVVAPESLSGVSVVTSTHGHTDHLDGATLNPLLAANPHAALVVAQATRHLVSERLQSPSARLVGMDAGQTEHCGAATITAVAAAHDTLETDEHGHHKYLGYVIRIGPFTLYHSGDTLAYDGLAAQLRRFAIDLALLPINGKLGNMDGAAAAQLAHDAGVRLVVPCHYGMFAFNTADPDELFVPACERLGQKYHVLQGGARLTLGGKAG